MYPEYDDYFEPSGFDEKIEELKNKLRESVKAEIKDELEELRRENKRLQEIEENFEAIKQDFEAKKNECLRAKANAEATAKEARLSELFDKYRLVTWSLDYDILYPEKCDKCNNDRNIIITLPSGRQVADDCKCNTPKKVYHPKENVLYSIESNKNNIRVYYKNRSYDYGEDMVADSSSVHPDEIINHNKPFDKIKVNCPREVFFSSLDECQEFCHYLNRKNGELEYKYNQSGTLFTKASGK
jgi:hypothetical protein|nr:MAG TPA_asm: hypothetical protein [Caudoviricetes sp.]